MKSIKLEKFMCHIIGESFVPVVVGQVRFYKDQIETIEVRTKTSKHFLKELDKLWKLFYASFYNIRKNAIETARITDRASRVNVRFNSVKEFFGRAFKEVFTAYNEKKAALYEALNKKRATIEQKQIDSLLADNTKLKLDLQHAIGRLAVYATAISYYALPETYNVYGVPMKKDGDSWDSDRGQVARIALEADKFYKLPGVN